jgi:hypothetical protein
MDFIYLAHDRDRCCIVVNMVINLQVQYNAGNSLSSSGTVSFSMTVLH